MSSYRAPGTRTTRNMTHRHMRFDNHCLGYGEADELFNHDIFECLPVLQV